MSETLHECPHCGDRWVGERDAFCCRKAAGDNALMQLTPKGILCATASKEGLSFAAADRIWTALESYCMRMLTDDSEYAALIFDGKGGVVIGANHHANEGTDSDATQS